MQIDLDSTIRDLNINGITIIPNFLDEKITEELSKCFDKCFDLKQDFTMNVKGHPFNESGLQSEINIDKTNNTKLQILKNIFHSKALYDLSNEYFYPHKFTFNEYLVCTHLKHSSQQILPWHFDRIQSLKFWIYVENTNEENGALEYVKGSHWEGRYRAASHLFSGKSVFEIPNDISNDRIMNYSIISANRGDLVIFDPDGFHRGGKIQSNLERKVLRADTFPIPSRKYNDRFLSQGWLLKSFFNISKHLHNAGFRMLGKKTADKSTNRNNN